MDELEWFSIGIRMIFLLLFVGIPPIKSGRWGCWLEEFESATGGIRVGFKIKRRLVGGGISVRPRIPRIAVFFYGRNSFS